MLRRLFYLPLWLMVALAAPAQYRVKLQITGIDNKPLPYTTLLCVPLTASTPPVSALADTTGNIAITVPGGSYRLELSATGYEKWQQQIILSHDTDLGLVRLKEKGTTLREVTISGRAPTIIRKTDRFIINIEGSTLATGQSVWDILPLGPGVTTDENGNILLNGISGVRVMLNNKILRMSGQQLTALLNGLRAEGVKSIEIIPHPPAAFDAEGVGGIIKINLSKTKNEGLSGDASGTYRQGVYPKLIGTAGLGYKKSKLVLFADYSYTKRKSFYTRQTVRSSTGSPVSLEMGENTVNQSDLQTIHAGAEFDINKNNSLGLDMTGSFNNGNTLRSDVFTQMFVHQTPDTSIRAQYPAGWKYNDYSATLNYQCNIDSQGKKLTIIADFLQPYSNDHTLYLNNYYDKNGQPGAYLNRNGIVTNTLNIYTAQADMVFPFRHSKSELSAGIKISVANTKNDNLYTLYDTLAGKWVTDGGQTNYFRYKENVAAGYLSYSTNLAGMEWMAGARLENTDGTSTSLSGAGSVHHQYLNLFPNLQVKYPFHKNKQSLSLSLSRRITRPPYNLLNSFAYFIDQYTLKTGNPDLKPSFASEAALTWMVSNRLSVSLDYYHITNQTGDFEQRDGNYTIVTIANLQTSDAAGLHAFWSKDLTPWWSMINQAGMSYLSYHDTVFSQHNTTVSLYSNHNLKLSKTLGLQLMGKFNLKGADRFYTTGFNYMVLNIGIQQSFNKDRFILKAGANDLFYRQGYKKLTTVYNDQHNTTITKFDTRLAYIGFVYRFNKGVPVKKPQPGKSNNEETNRAY